MLSIGPPLCTDIDDNDTNRDGNNVKRTEGQRGNIGQDC